MPQSAPGQAFVRETTRVRESATAVKALFGKHHLKTIMIEVAWAAVKTKGSYYREKYYRLKARRGARRAIVAIAHRLLKAVYHIIRDGVSFKDLGEGFLDQDNQQARLKRISQQAQKLGYQLVPQA